MSNTGNGVSNGALVSFGGASAYNAGWQVLQTYSLLGVQWYSYRSPYTGTVGFSPEFNNFAKMSGIEPISMEREANGVVSLTGSLAEKQSSATDSVNNVETYLTDKYVANLTSFSSKPADMRALCLSNDFGNARIPDAAFTIQDRLYGPISYIAEVKNYGVDLTGFSSGGQVGVQAATDGNLHRQQFPEPQFNLKAA